MFVKSSIAALLEAAACWFVLTRSLPSQQKSAPPRTLLVFGTAAAQIPGTLIREIDDPSNGDRWLLERGSANPGGPGRLVRIQRTAAASGVAQANRAGATTASSAYTPVIHTGDRLIVEENTPVVEARLAAVALTQAEAGGALRVRLEMGGNVMQAIAVGPGRAELAPETSVQP